MRIKGFDKNLCGLNGSFQYEIGKEYKTNAEHITVNDLHTDKVIHYGADLEEVHKYYSCDKYSYNRFCEIEVLGEEICTAQECASNHIKILREITGDELKTLLMQTDGNIGIFNRGENNIGDTNIGNLNLGNNNRGLFNGGCGNYGDYNLGDFNCGEGNNGCGNIGNYNSGYKNIGSNNTGDNNHGNYNTGMFNSCNNSTGYFCNKEDTVKIFNVDSGLTREEFLDSKYYNALISARFILTKYVKYGEDGEICNKLIKYPYKDACKNWWRELSQINKDIIISMPNFDANIFEEITGIKV